MERREELRRVAADDKFAFPGYRACQKIKSFGKLEFYPDWKELRGINSRTDRFKAFSGRFFKAIEDEIYKNPWFIKHVPVCERPHVIAQLKGDGLRYFENDFKAFESHFTPELMNQCECQLYRYALQKYPMEADQICRTITGLNRLSFRTGSRFVVEGRRMSGDMCTSLGNGFTNLMVVLYIISLKTDQIPLPVRGFVEGDDGLFATPFEITKEDYEQLGFTVEIHEIEDPCLGHFCGMSCFGNVVLKDPRRVFLGFGWTSSFIHGGDTIMDGLLKSKALSLCYEAPQCPVVGVLAREALALTTGVDEVKELQVFKKRPDEFPIPPFDPPEGARLAFERLYGVTLQDQLLAEAAIRDHDMDKLGRVISPLLPSALTYATRYVEVR